MNFVASFYTVYTLLCVVWWFTMGSFFKTWKNNFFQATSVSSTILHPIVTNSISQSLGQLNLQPPLPSSLPSVQTTPASQLPPIGVPPLPVTSTSMVLNIGQQADQHRKNAYQQVFNNQTPISTSVSVQNLSLPSDQNLTSFQHSLSLDETLQNYNVKKLPENLKQILERLVTYT